MDDAPLRPGWTMVIAFFNEERFLPATLASVAAQAMRPLALVLVDNGSTDGGAAAARNWATAQQDLEVRVLSETTPGQVHGLAAGIAAVETEFVAIGDADTIYPPDYLVKADAVLAEAPDVVAVFAHDSAGAPGSWREKWVRAGRDAVLLGVFRGQTYAGGYAHCYRTRALRAAGGYSPDLWPYVLKDHELVNRVSKQGRFGRSPDLWVLPSDRRADRGGVRWTLFERVLYHATPFLAKDWFFYRFLGPRLEGRGMRDTVLRTRGWDLPK